MPPPRQVYLLDPQQLKPETIAVTFAKTSRSPGSFREIAAELTDEQSAKFHEKWVVGYGHSSVAEHAVLHIAVENISRLAVETLEANRLASFTEKSTRYQKWSADQFFIPPELSEHPDLGVYIDTCKYLFQTYQDILPVLQNSVEKENPQRPNENLEAWERRIRSSFVDVGRFLLPAASLANVGITINARALEHAIRKMLSHPLQEVQNLGQELKQVAQQHIPTLVKYADHVPYLSKTRQTLKQVANHVLDNLPETPHKPLDWCQLVSYTTENTPRALAAALFRFGYKDYAHFTGVIQRMSLPEQQTLARCILGDLEPHDIPMRELEHITYTFDIVIDQGGYFELKRHRMMTQTPQELSIHEGYAVPRRISETGLDEVYQLAMQKASLAYLNLASFNPDIASYVIPNAFNRRVLITLNLRTAVHFIKLRTAPTAHFSMRRLAQRMAEQIRQTTPLLGSLIPRVQEETWQSIETQYFSNIARY